jgi:fatty acid desaturase
VSHREASPVRQTIARTRPAGGATSTFASSYTALAKRVKAEGLLERRPGYYILRGAVLAAAFAVGFALLFTLGRTWWQLLVAVYFSVVFTQTAFLAHDSAHKQIFSSGKHGELVSHLIGNLVVGLSYGWWMHKHTRHHANPNTVGRDDDIAPGPVTFVPEHALAHTGLRRWLGERQGYYLIPILTLAGLELHINAVKVVLGRKPIPNRLREGVLIGLRLIGFPVVVILALGPVLGLAFMAVQIATFGLYMAGTFVLNHTGMPQIANDQKVDYLRRQVLTSRNIAGGRFMEIFMGGLNYQIEHHLFPNMPRPHLAQAREIAKEYCDTHNILYTETSLTESYGIVIAYLNRVGLAAGGDPFDCPAATQFGR